ncbi:hypothetical protein [Embleya sp. NPDC020630]|uniref:hypothetical protein n=1 Tax=Embleya sp. NPDC020630 TaxID=3363979 RepID=UPI0037AA2A78
MTVTPTTTTGPGEDTPARLLYRAARERAAERDALAAYLRADQARNAAKLAASDAEYWAPAITALADIDTWTGYPETPHADGACSSGAVTHLGDGIWAWSTDRDGAPLVALIAPCACGFFQTIAIHGPEDVDSAITRAYDARDRPDPICRDLHA